VQSIVMSTTVCLSVHSHISNTTRAVVWKGVGHGGVVMATTSSLTGRLYQ